MLKVYFKYSVQQTVSHTSHLDDDDDDDDSDFDDDDDDDDDD